MRLPQTAVERSLFSSDLRLSTLNFQSFSETPSGSCNAHTYAPDKTRAPARATHSTSPTSSCTVGYVPTFPPLPAASTRPPGCAHSHPPPIHSLPRAALLPTRNLR